MHETFSPNFKGYIDELQANSREVVVRGWAAGSADFSTEDISVFSPETNSAIPSQRELSQRPDVYSFYGQSDIRYLSSGFRVRFPAQRTECFIMIKGERVFSVAGDKFAGLVLDDIVKLNQNAKTELIVVDNFYQNPDFVREYALSRNFKANELYHKGNRTEERFIPSWAQDEFSRLLNKKVTEFVGATGVFQYCVAQDSVVYHYDTQEYAAMVYLSPDAPLQTGTQTFRSKLTGLYGAATDEDAVRLGKTKEELDRLSFNGNNFYDRNNMELVDSVANVFNRCVIFNARALHAASGYYGSNKENSRLFHLYFFNC
jgi:hypothetical protein